MAFRSGGGGHRPGGGGFRSGGGSGGYRRFPREMTKIKCSKCGKEAEVPFKPREGSPVYCRECFMEMKGIKPRQEHKSEDSEETEDSDESEDSEEEME